MAIIVCENVDWILLAQVRTSGRFFLSTGNSTSSFSKFWEFIDQSKGQEFDKNAAATNAHVLQRHVTPHQ
jgi:hypothetical protein